MAASHRLSMPSLTLRGSGDYSILIFFPACIRRFIELELSAGSAGNVAFSIAGRPGTRRSHNEYLSYWVIKSGDWELDQVISLSTKFLVWYSAPLRHIYSAAGNKGHRRHRFSLHFFRFKIERSLTPANVVSCVKQFPPQSISLSNGRYPRCYKHVR